MSKTGLETATAKLIEHLGKGKVFTDEATLLEYSEDMTEIPGALPDVVVKAVSVEEIQYVLRIANQHRIPVVPRVANTNLGGLAIPEWGGIVLDLSNMNRILEVNEEDMYMVIEPGVSWADVRRHLDQHYPTLRFGYSLSPPETSVLCNCLLDGLTNLSLKYGSVSHWINGVEAVLPTGEVVCTGSSVFSRFWCTNSSVPNLTGLFVNFQGTTGIVTKLAVQLFPKPKFRKRMFILAYDVDKTFSFIKRLAREDICDDCGGLSWPVGKMLFGEAQPLYHDPDEPLFFIYLDVSHNFENIFHAKLEAIRGLLSEHRKEGARFEDPFDVTNIVALEPAFQKFADFPTRLDFLLDRGGLTWIGTYGPTSQWEIGVKRGMEIMMKHGFPPTVVTRPMMGGHFGVLRFITVFDKRNAEEVQRVTALNTELCDIVIDKGFIPYKTPVWVLKRHRDKINANFLALLKKIKATIDPNNIMNPGKWLL